MPQRSVHTGHGSPTALADNVRILARNIGRVRIGGAILPALIYGRYEPLLNDHEQIYAYARTLGAERVVVLCNLSGKAAEWDAQALSLEGATCVLANFSEAQEGHRLKAWEARVYKAAT